MKKYIKIDNIENFETDELDFSLHVDFKISDEDDYEFFDKFYKLDVTQKF